MTIPNETAHRLVGMIYEAALDEHKWAPFLEVFTQALGSDTSMLRSDDAQTLSKNFVTGKGDDPHWKSAINQCLDEIFSAVQFSLSEKIKPSDCNDYDQPQEKTQAIRMFLTQDLGHRLMFAVQRGILAGAISEESAKMMDILAPHITRAVQVHQKIRSVTLEKEWALGAIDNLRIAVILTNSSGTPFFFNSAAELILKNCPPIKIHQGKLALLTQSETTQLYKLINDSAQVTPDPGHSMGGDMRITCPNGDLLHCMVMPVSPELTSRMNIRFSSGGAALFLSKPGNLNIIPERLANLYDLSPKEAKLVSKLAALMSVEQAAADLSMTVGTARSHLKSVFSKTGVRSQSQLILLLATGTLAALRK